MSVRKLDEYFRQIGRAVRSGQVDVEGVLRALVDLLLRELRGLSAQRVTSSSAQSEHLEGRLAVIERELQELVEAVNSLSSAVGELRREVVSLRREVESLRSTVDRGEKEAEVRQPKWLKEVLSRIGSRGYVLLHELESYTTEYDPDLAAKHGLVTISVGGNVVLIRLENLKEFLAMLPNLKTSDDVEAASMLGRYAQLFSLLRRAGAIIYKGGWKVDESIVKALERVERISRAGSLRP